MTTNTRAALTAHTAQSLGCTAEEAAMLGDLFPGRAPERLSLDREAGQGWLYFWDEKAPAALGTCPRSARLLASLLAGR